MSASTDLQQARSLLAAMKSMLNLLYGYTPYIYIYIYILDFFDVASLHTSCDARSSPGLSSLCALDAVACLDHPSFSLVSLKYGTLAAQAKGTVLPLSTDPINLIQTREHCSEGCRNLYGERAARQKGPGVGGRRATQYLVVIYEKAA